MSATDYIAPTLVAGGLGLAAGAGARLGKHLIQSLQGRDTGSPVQLKKLVTPTTKLPVEVSPEEAEELRRQGVNVKTALHRKLAEGFIQNTLGGAAGVGAAYGGWTAISNLLDKSKRDAAKQRVDTQRHRVEKLLDTQAEPLDQPVQNAIKVAEDQWIKVSFQNPITSIADSGVSAAADSVGSLLAPAGWVVGGAGVLKGIQAYRAAAEKNKQNEVIKALKNVHENQPEQPSQVEMVPVLRQRQVKRALAILRAR